jgi:HAD superfamily hydrolase (TIGR01549 family)
MATDSDRSARPGVLFDIDGTLVDDNYLHVVAWWNAFRRHGHDVSMVDIHRRIGMGAKDLVRDLLGELDEKVVKGHQRFYAPFLEQLRRFPESRELLHDCKSLGLAVVLATSAEPAEVEALTTTLDADEVLDAVTGAEDAGAAKPDPAILFAAMKKANLRPENCVMVGDTVWDIKAATSAGLPCVALLSGGIGRDELEAAGATATYAHVGELREELDASPIGRLAKSGLATG